MCGCPRRNTSRCDVLYGFTLVPVAPTAKRARAWSRRVSCTCDPMVPLWCAGALAMVVTPLSVQSRTKVARVHPRMSVERSAVSAIALLPSTPPDEAYDIVTTPANWADLFLFASKVEATDGADSEAPLRKGTRIRELAGVPPILNELFWMTTVSDPKRGVLELASAGGSVLDRIGARDAKLSVLVTRRVIRGRGAARGRRRSCSRLRAWCVRGNALPVEGEGGWHLAKGRFGNMDRPASSSRRDSISYRGLVLCVVSASFFVKSREPSPFSIYAHAPARVALARAVPTLGPSASSSALRPTARTRRRNIPRRQRAVCAAAASRERDQPALSCARDHTRAGRAARRASAQLPAADLPPEPS